MLRRRFAGASIAVAVLVGLAAARRAHSALPDPMQEAFVEAAKRISPAVVHIKVEKEVGGRANDPFDLFGDEFFRRFFRFRAPRYRARGQGSGVIVDPTGVILTNNHVVGGADKVTVKLADGRELQAEPIGTDWKSDVAAIRIRGGPFPSAAFGDSDKLRVGEWVLAVGNPFGLDRTVTAGIVSAHGRANVGIAEYEDFIQTDAPINPGNSGGPLVNLKGEMVGINTAIFSRSGGYMGIGFAIPLNMAKVILEKLRAEGRVQRALLGVGIQDLTPALAEALGLPETSGAIVTEVMPGLPAERAGFRRGDVIVELDGRPVAGRSDLRNRIALSPVGRPVDIALLRDGRRLALRPTLDELPSEKARGPAGDFWRGPEPERGGEEKIGLSLRPVTPALARRLGYPERGGLLVMGVVPGSPAEEAGLRPRDLVMEAGGRRVGTLEDFAEIVLSAPRGRPLALLVRGPEGFRFLALKVP